ncbi:MAG: cadherin-like domain-containing protein, partial [Acidobacteria bacterium]|nr:cadherin-like domain-containing protein [Acidobacteriota bacterium]
MRRLYLLALTLFALVLVVWTAGVDAVQEPHPSIEVHRITDTLYMLGSGMETGGNIAVLIAESGVVLVDTKLEGYGPDILDHLRRLTDKPVTMIINTHVHYDHSGANTEFPDTVQFVAHENIRRHWARTDCQPIPTNCDDFQGENRKYLPKTTFSDRLSLFAGTPDQIDLYYFGRGHTDGDTFVVFKEARAMHVGDMFLGKTLPFIDAENGNGGSAIATVTVAVSPVDEGHAPVANDDTYLMVQNTALDATLTVPAPGVLANDTDSENHPLTALLDDSPSNGGVILNPDGGFTYTPLTTTFTGTATFTYKASDGVADSVASVTIEVGTMHVANLVAVIYDDGKTWRARMFVFVDDKLSAPVEGAIVTSTWSDASGSPQELQCTTGGGGLGIVDQGISRDGGWCSVWILDLPKKTSSVTFKVMDVVHGDLQYAPSE